MASNARNLSKLLGTSTQVPTTALPPAIADLETVGQTLSGGEIAPSSIKSNTLTQSFDSNQAVTFNMSDSIDAVSPIVSVFKEVPVSGVSSKGKWDVNANATNYEFFDEKPISYSSTTLTPSATGDGTFTSSNPVVSGYSFSNFAYDSVTQATGRSGNNEAIKFNNNGTKLYLVSDGGPDGVYQYSLSTAYDISTLSYDNVSFSITQDSSPRDIWFNADGTKMFILGVNNKTIYRYGLTTGFDLSTASYDSVSLSVNYGTASPMGFFFNGNATKLYVIIAGGGNSGDSTVYERQLPGAYDISSATAVSSFNYDESDLPGSLTEAYASRGLFNNDGTKMYLNIQRMPDLSTKAIIEYNLSTAYDLSTISRASIQSLTTGTGNPGDDNRGIAWNGDGTKLITLTEPGNLFRFTSSASTAFSSSDVGKKVVGNSGSAIITSTAGAYTSVTPFADTSAISSWQLFGSEGKADGTGIQLSGYSSGYDLSSPSNVKSWATAASPVENISSAMLGSDGTKGFYLDRGNDQVVYITLSTAFDISTATRQGAFSMTSAEGARALYIFGDGTRVFTASPETEYIRRYDLSTPWDVNSATQVGIFYQVSQENAMNGLEFKPDGTKMYVCGTQNNTAYQYSLSTAWDITTATYDSKSLSVNDLGTSAMDLRFNSNGTKLFVMRNTGQILTYNLSTPWDISTGSYSSGETWVTGYTNVWGFSFANNGTKILISNYGANPDELVMYDIGSILHPYSQYSPALTNSSNGQINSSSWLDINSMTADETKNGGDIFYAVSTDNRTSWGVANASDGVRKIAKNNSGTWQYNNNAGSSVSVGFGLSSPSYDNKSYTVPHSSPRGMYLKSDGTELYIGAYTGHVYQYTLSTPNDISTASSTGNYNIDEVYDTVALTFKPDGTKMYATGGTVVYQYTLSTAWDITTASYDSVSYTPSDFGGSSDIHSLNFNSDGTKLFMSDDRTSYRRIREYTLSTPYVISSASTTSNYLYHAKNAVRAVDFNSDGTKIFLSSYTTQFVYQYNLASAYTLSSSQGSTADVEYDATSTISSNMYNIAFSNDGTKLFILESSTPSVKQFSTTSTTIGYGTGETWVNGTNNNEHATLQEALSAQAFNKMDKAQLDTVADGYHFSQDSADTLDLMIAPYAASGSSPISDGVTINYDAEALIREAIPGTDYIAEFPNPTTLNITAVGAANLKIRAQ